MEASELASFFIVSAKSRILLSSFVPMLRTMTGALSSPMNLKQPVTVSVT